jgi:hypothetical protein
MEGYGMLDPFESQKNRTLVDMYSSKAAFKKQVKSRYLPWYSACIFAQP